MKSYPIHDQIITIFLTLSHRMHVDSHNKYHIGLLNTRYLYICEYIQSSRMIYNERSYVIKYFSECK